MRPSESGGNRRGSLPQLLNQLPRVLAFVGKLMRLLQPAAPVDVEVALNDGRRMPRHQQAAQQGLMARAGRAQCPAGGARRTGDPRALRGRRGREAVLRAKDTRQLPALQKLCRDCHGPRARALHPKLRVGAVSVMRASIDGPHGLGATHGRLNHFHAQDRSAVYSAPWVSTILRSVERLCLALEF